jgi:hypothetical protein
MSLLEWPLFPPPLICELKKTMLLILTYALHVLYTKFKHLCFTSHPQVFYLFIDVPTLRPNLQLQNTT